MSSRAIREFSGFFPFIDLGNGILLPTYFLVISLVFCVCIFWLVKRARQFELSVQAALDLALVVMVGAFLGSRIFHVIFEAPQYYLQSPLRIFEFWMGGFVWYGGALLGAGFGLAWVRWKKLPPTVWLDFSAPVGSLGYALGRISCLMTGCCFGSVCHLSSGFAFRHPTQFYAILWESGVLGLLLYIEHRRRARNAPAWLRTPGSLFCLWVTLHSAGRILMEIFRADERGPAPLGLSLSTWISLGLILSSISLLFRQFKNSSSGTIDEKSLK